MVSCIATQTLILLIAPNQCIRSRMCDIAGSKFSKVCLTSQGRHTHLRFVGVRTICLAEQLRMRETVRSQTPVRLPAYQDVCAEIMS